MQDNLTKDVLAAARAGMSYGNWKALHPVTRPDADPMIETLEKRDDSVYKQCEVCGKEFRVCNKFKAVCSVECRAIYERDHFREYQRKYRERRRKEKENANAN